jgi:hypothetical protein
MLPETPYITVLDEFNYFVLFQQAVILVTISLAAKTGHNTPEEDDALAATMVISFGLFSVAYAIRFTLAMRHRDKRLGRVNESFKERFAHLG